MRIPPAVSGMRLDRALAVLSRERGLRISRTEWQRRIERGEVTLAARRAKPDGAVSAGEWISVRLPDEGEVPPVLPEPIPLDVRFEDEHLAVVVKPAGMLVHPAYGRPSGTIVNAFLHRWGTKPYTVHRLDRDTEGLLLVARSSSIARALSEAIATKRVERRYLAVVAGRVKRDGFTIMGHLKATLRVHGLKRRTVMVADPTEGRLSKTRVQVVSREEATTELAIELGTGRQNQIRAHLASIGHPILGDALYGGPPSDRLHLSAVELSFRHPVSGQRLTFEL